MYSTSRFTSLFLVPLLAVAACGAPDETDTMDPMDEVPETPETTPPGEMETEMPETVTLGLEAVNESGVTGTVIASHRGDSVLVQVQVQGVSEGEELAAHVHQGSCADGGPVQVPLTSVTIEGGSGTSTTVLGMDQLPEDQSAFIQVHGPGGPPVACGDLPEHGSEM